VAQAILLKEVDSLGERGDVIDVAPEPLAEAQRLGAKVAPSVAALAEVADFLEEDRLGHRVVPSLPDGRAPARGAVRDHHRSDT